MNLWINGFVTDTHLSQHHPHRLVRRHSRPLCECSREGLVADLGAEELYFAVVEGLDGREWGEATDVLQGGGDAAQPGGMLGLATAMGDGGVAEDGE